MTESAPNWKSPGGPSSQPRVHLASPYTRLDGGPLTACSALIVSTWTPTDEAVTCKVCLYGQRRVAE
jgi:hypothetical protein